MAEKCLPRRQFVDLPILYRYVKIQNYNLYNWKNYLY